MMMIIIISASFRTE